MANELIDQVRNALQTPMAALGELGYEAEFTDSAIYMTIADAVEDYNVEFNTTLTSVVTVDEETGLATAIAITPEATGQLRRVVALQAAYILIDEWTRLNIFNGELGIAVRDGLGSISTQGRATHATLAVERAAKDVKHAVMLTKIRAAQAASGYFNPGEPVA